MNWPELKNLLDEALDLPRQDRPSFLDRHCADRPELRAELEAYLALEDEVTDFIETPLVDILAGRVAELRKGELLGPYRLGDLLAQGGMGVVFHAERVDGAYAQNVAVKVLKRGLDTGEIIRRFQRERDILADLDHPYIARILDGGSTDDGLPYFVMTRVEGVPIDTWCDQNALDASARIELVRKVCEAVHAAHRNLIVHCDLKPSNILVTEDGAPRLLDFGIAKWLRPTGTDATRTALGLRFGTPGYSSPEQLGGGSITTASDIYSLGALLRKLLTGKTTAKPGSRRLHGDLAAIVDKATRAEPERRYASVAEMAEDLRRHLARLPILARRDSLLYHAVRLVQRRPFAVAASTVLTAALLLIGFTTERARRQQLRADDIRGAYLELLEAIDPTGGEAGSKAAREALEQALRTELVSDPADRALLLDRIGRIYYRLGLVSDARELLETSLELRRSIPDLDPKLLIASLNNLALVLLQEGEAPRAHELLDEARRLREEKDLDDTSLLDELSARATALQNEGHLVEAERIFREVLPGLHAVYGEHSLEFAKGLNNLGLVLLLRDRLEEAERLLRQSLSLREEIFGLEDPNLVASLANLAMLFIHKDEKTMAVETFERALRIRQQRLGEDNPRTAASSASLAFALLERGTPQDLERAEGLLRGAEDIFLQTHGEHHGNTLVTQRNLAAVHLAQGRLDEAESLARRVATAASSTWPEGHWRQADIDCLLGACLTALGRLDEAEPLLRGGLATLERTQAASSPYVRAARRWLAMLESARDR